MTEREIDALVAEKVMGFKWGESRCRICGWKMAQSAAVGCVLGNCSQRPAPSRHADEPAHYSSEIAEAWKVLEEVAKRFRRFEVHAVEGGYVAMISGGTSDINESYIVNTEAATAPRAICLAALESLGVKVPE